MGKVLIRNLYEHLFSHPNFHFGVDRDVDVSGYEIDIGGH
jgi:hypothetical protein